MTGFVQRTASSGRLAQLLDRYQVPLAIVIATALLMAMHQSFRFVTHHFDSGQYWALATLENLGHLPSSRGYVFPFLLLPLNYVCSISPDPALTYRGGMSLIYGVLLTTLVPAAFREAFGGTISLVRRLVPVLLLAVLFPGLLLYVLSDLPAMLMAFAALMCALRALKPTASRRQFIGALFAAGLLMGAAYNSRTIYLFAAIPLGLLVLWTVRGGPWVKAPFPRWLGLLAFAAGAIAVSLPQLAINKRTQGINSLAVQSVINSKSLFAIQLAWGMTLQRYETAVTGEALGAQLYYFDPAGARLFDHVAGGGDLFSIPYYLKVVAQHPLHFLGLYTRHIINGLDVRDGLVYTHKLSPRRNSTALLNFLVLALAVWVLVTIRPRIAQPAGTDRWPVPASWPMALAVLVLPVAAIVPGAVETRFFLPVHLLAYCVLAMHFDAAQLKQNFRQHGRAVLLLLLVGAAVFFAVTFSTMANLRYDLPELYLSGP